MAGLSLFAKPDPIEGERAAMATRAVVIDNDATASLGVKVALERLGITVVAELSRIEEAEACPAELVCCDLVLSREGLALQGAAGVAELVSRGRQVLALSSVARSHEVGNVIGAGALGFIDRDDLDWDDFARAVADVGAGRRHLSRSLAARLLSDLHERPLPESLELDGGSRQHLEAIFAKGDVALAALALQELEALTARVWAVWSRRAVRYRLELTSRHLEVLRRFHDGESAEQIGRALRVSPRTIQADQDRIKAMLFATYGRDIKREAACRLVWQLVDGQLAWGKNLRTAVTTSDGPG